MHVGDNIRRLRKSRGLSQGEVSARGGFDRPYISRVETGKQTPSLKFLRRLGEILELPIAEFFVFPVMGISDDWLSEFSRERLYVDVPPLECSTLGALRDRRVPVRALRYPTLRARLRIGELVSEFSAPSPDVFALRVPDNRAAPEALQGDVVVVDPHGIPRHGDLVALEPSPGAASELRVLQEANGKKVFVTFDGESPPIAEPEFVWGRVFHKVHVYPVEVSG